VREDIVFSGSSKRLDGHRPNDRGLLTGRRLLISTRPVWHAGG